jgi:hypothetical protein
MSKKNITATDLAVILDSPNIATSVDLKVSKSDIVDMIIEEKRGILEEKLNKLNKESIELRDCAIVKVEDVIKRQREMALNSKKTVVSAFKKAYPNTSIHYYGELNAKHIAVSIAQNRFRNNSSEYQAIRDNVGIIMVDEPETREGGGRLQMHVLTPKDELEKLRKDVDDAVFSWVKAEDKVEAIQKELNELGKRGASVRVELTKRLLSASKEGKTIIQALNEISLSMQSNTNFGIPSSKE